MSASFVDLSLKQNYKSTGQLLVVRFNYGARGLLQLELISGLFVLADSYVTA